jgi:hypothetical protein
VELACLVAEFNGGSMKKIMMSAGFLFVLAVLFPGLAKASCEGFSGQYALSSLGCYTINHGNKYSDHTYTGMQIDANNQNSLSMFYELGSPGHGFITVYVADGKPHEGDIYNTGKSYVASCDNTRIHSVREGMLVAPMDMTFTKNPDQTYTLTETITSADPFVRSCTFVKAR